MMKRHFYTLFTLLAVSVLVVSFVACKRNSAKEDATEIKETPVSGRADVLVEESIFPIVEDVRDVFEFEYSNISLNLIKKSENEILDLIYKDSLRIAVLPRKLDSVEVSHFAGKVVPKMTHFASDAVVFVAHKKFKDSILDYEKLVHNLKASDATNETLLIFDNVNSSVSEQFRKATGVRDLSSDHVFFLPSTTDVVEYVQKNTQAVGVIGLNWLVQPNQAIQSKLDDLKVLAVKNPKDGKFYKPSQNNIAEGTYPIIRELYVLDFQGKSGLGMGFASYIAGYKGQRIVLKSGLVPFKVPPREIVVRKSIE